MSRIRHCVECPNCLTRYLISCTPYSNGAYLRPALSGRWEEYILYCPCRRGGTLSRWKATAEMPCKVSNAAFRRGYGAAAEIVPVRKKPWSIDVSQYLNEWNSQDRPKSTS